MSAVWSVLLALMTLSRQADVKPQGDDFELNSERLGETLSSFQSLHPKARCINSSKTRKDCYQWEDVSIFGLTAHPRSACLPETHSSADCAEGLTAEFADDHLVLLVYAVGGSDKKGAAAELKKRYGAPAIDTSEATIWTGAKARTLSVIVGKASEGSEGKSLITFMIQG
jgi:hypothetical protein